MVGTGVVVVVVDGKVIVVVVGVVDVINFDGIDGVDGVVVAVEPGCDNKSTSLKIWL